ncbi:MAG TPA: hypothetical protein VK524_29870 [Polyangiaceae bacterium]|nr:hypothetical protein [Polyangiaceae bacterium]
MARNLSRTKSSRTLRGAFALALFAGLGASLLGCSGEENTGEQREKFDRLVYAVRQHTVLGSDGAVSINVAGGMGQVMDYNRYEPGGRLEIYDLTTGKIENVLADIPTADVSSLDVSYDATKVVFTMKTSGDDNYHVYWASLTPGGDGKYEIHQLTFGPQDDEHAIWVPGERIAFITNQAYTEMGTRADEYNHSRAVTQIASITLGGGDSDRKLCSQNLSHTINLFPMADGRIGFSRWEHLENVNDVKLFAMNPDCTQMVAVSGQHGKPSNSLVQVSETHTPNVFLAIATNRENTIQSGALIQIDARNASDPLRVNEEEPAYKELTPAVPTGEAPSPVGRYRAPHGLPDGRILTSWASGVVNETNELQLNPPDFGVYVYDPRGRVNKLIVNHEDTWELYAKPVVTRTEPPIIGSVQRSADSSVPARFGSVDVRQTSLGTLHGNTVSGAQFEEGTSIDDALKQAKKVRIIEGFSSEGSPGTSMFGLTMAEGAAILGEATVYSDGSWLADIPPYVPVHLQPIDEFDLAIRNQTTWIQGMPGEDRVCGGCHENRSAPVLPGGQALTQAAGIGAQNFLLPVANRVEYPWYGANDAANPNEIQKLLNAKCVSCHNATTNGSGPQQYYEIEMTDEATGEVTPFRIARLDLSSTEVTVTYDRETRAWPASYVSLFYPAAFKMEMGMGAELTSGTLPPEWAVPSDARHSALIEKLNVKSSVDASKFAWQLGQAFSNTDIAGGTRTDHAAAAGLTRDELVKLIRAIDMGGQYYARQNSDFQAYGSDPVAGGGTKY